MNGNWGKKLLVAAAATAFAGSLAFAQTSIEEGKRKVKSKIPPAVPELARRMNITGKVKIEVVIAADEAMVSISCGGGGYGHPHEREPSRVLADVREGWISRERAETIYGVALDPEDAIDLDATARLRNRG